MLKARAPRSYEAMLIEADNGDPSAYFVGDGSTQSNPYIGIDIAEDNVELQKKVISSQLKASGFKDNYVKVIVQDYEDKNELFAAAKEAQTELKKVEDERKATYAEQAKQAQAQTVAEQETFISGVQDILESGAVGNFTLPKADKENFAKYALSNIRHLGDNKFALVKEITSDNINQILETEYFSHKGGDLGKLVARKAGTENVKRIRKNVKKDKVSAGQVEKNKSNNIPLADL